LSALIVDTKHDNGYPETCLLHGRVRVLIASPLIISSIIHPKEYIEPPIMADLEEVRVDR